MPLVAFHGRTLPLGIDETTKEIVAVEFTKSRVHESQWVPLLLEQIPDPLGHGSGDGAGDTQPCDEAVLGRGAASPFVPRRTAPACGASAAAGWRTVRNQGLPQSKLQGRPAWQGLSG